MTPPDGVGRFDATGTGVETIVRGSGIYNLAAGRRTMAAPDRRYSTGLTFLDRRLDGGLPVGDLVAIAAPPSSQSELLLKQLLWTRQSLYVSTIRPPDEVRDWAESGPALAPTGLPELTVRTRRPETLVDGFDAGSLSESFLLLNRANGLEGASQETYVEFLNVVKQALRRTDSVGFLHCPAAENDPRHRDLTLTRADQVWRLDVQSLSREVKNRLVIPKARNSRAPQQPIDIVMTDRIKIDTSRRIA